MAKLGPTLWRDIMGFLRRNHPTICRRWFEDLQPIDLKAGTLRIRTRTAVQKGYLQQHCQEHFTEAAQDVTGALVAVQFVEGPPHGQNARSAGSTARSGEQSTASVSRGSSAALEGQRLGEVVLSPDYCFDGFVTGPGNQFNALEQSPTVIRLHLDRRAVNRCRLFGNAVLDRESEQYAIPSWHDRDVFVAQLLGEQRVLIDQGVLHTTLGAHFGAINAANMRSAHALVESGKARGKIVLEDFQ